MGNYLHHHRAFCEHLGKLAGLEVSWDGNGALPLKRKALHSAMELFGRRPDLTIGSDVILARGGLEISLFRGGRDVQVHISKEGKLIISGHRPEIRSDFIISESIINDRLLNALEREVPFNRGCPHLDFMRDEDLSLQVPFNNFSFVRLVSSNKKEIPELLIGRSAFLSGVYALHEISDIPADLIRDQPLSNQTRLKELVDAYLAEIGGECVPA